MAAILAPIAVSTGPFGWFALASAGAILVFFLNSSKKKRNRRTRRRWKRNSGGYTKWDAMKDTKASKKEVDMAWRDAARDAIGTKW